MVHLIHDTTDDLVRQTPERSGRWDGRQYILNKTNRDQCDALVVCERLRRPVRARAPRSRTIFVTWEPPSVRSYDARFLAQFGAVISPHADLPHPNVIRMQPGLPWTVGCLGDGHDTSRTTLDYDALSQMPPPRKTKLLSVVCSNKAMTEGHRQRLRLLDVLREEFGENLDIFGRGFRPIEDKWDALEPYKYHLALENSESDDYWSEKLADAFLGFCFPIYAGCTNITRYFSSTALRTITRTDPRSAAAILKTIVEEQTYERHLAEVVAARQLVLERYNLFAMLNHVIGGLPGGPAENLSLLPEHRFTASLSQRIKGRLRGLLMR